MKKIILFLLTLGFSTSPLFANESGRYFYEGDGHLSLAQQKKGAKIDVQYRTAAGEYPDEALKKIDAFFGLNRAQMGEGISLRLISMLDYLQDKFSPDSTLSILSGYRSPAYNESLRRKGRLAGQTSYHMDGMAADVVFPNVAAEKIWNYVKSLDCCGIGMYGGKAVHIDSGKPRFWTSETALPKTKEPPENKNIALSIDKDIYHAGEKMRLFFSGISDYPFGIKTDFALKDGNKTLQHFIPDLHNTQMIETNCAAVVERKDARLIYWTLPGNLRDGKNLSVTVSFCGHHYSKMPERIESRNFEIR